MARVAPYAKAIIAAIVAGLSALTAGLVADGLSDAEIITAIVAFLVGLGAVFTVPNRPRDP
jgi:hypothetical protein